MIVEASVTIRGTRAEVWRAITSLEAAASFVSGIERIDMIARPAQGVVGMRWRETRVLFGKPATVEKWITDAVDGERYTTRAESDGYVFVTTKRVTGSDGSVGLSESHESIPQTLTARLSMLMMFFFRGVIRKALLQDLQDIRTAVEARRFAA